MKLKSIAIPIAISTSILPMKVEAKQNDAQPNMVLIFVDDTGWGTFAPNIQDFNVSQLNQAFIKNSVRDYTVAEGIEAATKSMPHLTKYCDEGVRFTNAYVTANVSSPSRVGLLTSAYQQRHGLYINQEAEKGVPTDIKLMPQILQENGYVNGVFGKYHNGNSIDKKLRTCDPAHHPLNRGFDYFYGFNSSGTEYYDSKIIYRNNENVIPDDYLTDQFTNEAVAFIEQNKGVPKLVYVPYNALHGPLGAPAPEKYLSRFNYKSKILNNYSAYTAAVDDGVATIMSAMEQIGELENTILVFLSDNGAPGGAVSTIPKNGHLSGFKGQSQQGGYRVPMFIWYGQNIKPQRVSDQVVSSMDIFPTLMDIAGINLPKDQVVDGTSLAPILFDDSNKPIHSHLVWMSQHAQNWAMNKVHDQNIAQAAFMVREGDFILRYVVEFDTFYLHNVTEDPGEHIDIASKYPEKVESMKSLFKEWFVEMKQPNSWDRELWQNVQFWDTTIPPAKAIDRTKIAQTKKKRGK